LKTFVDECPRFAIKFYRRRKSDVTAQS